MINSKTRGAVQIYLATIVCLLAAALFWPITWKQESDAFGLVHSLSIGPHHFWFMLAGFAGIYNGFGWVLLAALMLGSFGAGPWITTAVSLLIVLDRCRGPSLSWWFRLKDWICLLALAFAPALPEPMRIPLGFFAAILLCFDCGFQVNSMMAAVVIAQTLRAEAPSTEIAVAILVLTFILQCFWIGTQGKSSLGALFHHAVITQVFLGVVLLPAPFFFPGMISSIAIVIWFDLLRPFRPSESGSQVAGTAFLVSALPLFGAVLIGKRLHDVNMPWAIPLVPLLTMAGVYSRLHQPNVLARDRGLPLWSLSILVLFVGLLFWFGSTTFESLDPQTMGPILGLSLTGVVLGGFLAHFWTPRGRASALKAAILKMATKGSVTVKSVGYWVRSDRRWVATDFGPAELNLEYAFAKLFFAGVISFFLFIGFRLLRSGGWI